MHSITVRHENAIELLFGFGVTRKVHSPGGRKREHYRHRHGTIRVPPSTTSEKFRKLGERRLTCNPKAGPHLSNQKLLQAPAESSCVSLQKVPSDGQVSKITEAGEIWVIYRVHLDSSFWIKVNPLSIKIHTKPSKISNTTSKIQHACPALHHNECVKCNLTGF